MRKIVNGYSMYPFLKPMDVCVMAPGDIQLGDIVQYSYSDTEQDIVHRVIGIDPSKKTALIKGDNLPREYTEYINFSDIKAKVVRVERAGRARKLSRTGSIFIALLSKRDLTPHLIRKRLLGPIISKIIKTSGYLKLRKKMYENLMFMEKGDSCATDIYAILNDKKCARVSVEYIKGKGAFITADIHYKDRNSSLVSRIMQKAIDIVRERYGNDCNIYIADPLLEDLIRDEKAQSVRREVIFGEDINKCLIK